MLMYQQQSLWLLLIILVSCPRVLDPFWISHSPPSSLECPPQATEPLFGSFSQKAKTVLLSISLLWKSTPPFPAPPIKPSFIPEASTAISLSLWPPTLSAESLRRVCWRRRRAWRGRGRRSSLPSLLSPVSSHRRWSLQPREQRWPAGRLIGKSSASQVTPFLLCLVLLASSFSWRSFWLFVSPIACGLWLVVELTQVCRWNCEGG